MKRWHKLFFRQLITAVSTGLFPDVCFSCNQFIDREADKWESPNCINYEILKNENPHRVFSKIMAPCLCRDCLENFFPVSSPMCTRCGLQFKSPVGEDRVCGECISDSKPFVFARSCGQFAGTLMKLVHAYKYNGKNGLGRPLGKLMHVHFMKHYTGVPIDFIIPVPLHRKKLIKRGFDQVLLMLYHWPWSGNGIGIKEINGAALNPKLLLRVKNTDTQTGLSRKERGRNIKNAFAVTDQSSIINKSVLLIDDVYTTGATLEECAYALKHAGASRIYFMTLARAM